MVSFICHLWCRKNISAHHLSHCPPPPSTSSTAAVRAGWGRDPEPDVGDVYDVRVPVVEGRLVMGRLLKVRFQTFVLRSFLY